MEQSVLNEEAGAYNEEASAYREEAAAEQEVSLVLLVAGFFSLAFVCFCVHSLCLQGVDNSHFGYGTGGSVSGGQESW